ncbi:MAG: SDR family NAD(P)-dependent oxidoreductase [Myxococcota bacterium]
MSTQEKKAGSSEGARVLVTGATGGLGRVVVSTLLAAGHRVIATDLSKYRLDQLEARLEAPSGLTCLTADVTHPEEVAYLFARIHEDHGPIEGVAHLVGGWAGGSTLDEVSDEVFEQMLTLNLRSSFLVMREAVRWMRPKGGGSVVVISSVAAIPGSGAPGSAAYAASKAALSSLVDSVAAENKTWNVRVNAIMPTTIRTQANVEAMPTAEHYRWVTPEEIAETIRFLLSPAASGVTGAHLKLAGRL